MKFSKTIKILKIFLYKIFIILFFYSYAYSQSNSTNPNSGYGAIWGIIICAWICFKRRKEPIGGWLLYYYIQLYFGTAFFLFLALGSFENFISSNWDDTSLYLLYLVSTLPQYILSVFEVIFASFLLKARFRNSKSVDRLRIVFLFLIVFSIIELVINIYYWEQNVPFDLLRLGRSCIWILYFSFSERVRSVLIDNNWNEWEYNAKDMNTRVYSKKTKQIAPNISEKNILSDDNLPLKNELNKNKLNIFNRLKKIPKGIFRLIFVFSFIISFVIGGIAESNDKYSDGESFIGAFFFSMIIYWVLIRVGIWIYDGFMEEK